jgi:UDP-N-acetylmuramoyl-tripeptide--D-alanyl-D-alanine ligase
MTKARWTTEDVIEAAGAKLLSGGDSSGFGSISTDSRTIEPDALFVALTGDNFNGHEFLGIARAKGATGFLVSDASRISEAGDGTVLLVEDTLTALGDLARHHLRRLGVDVLAVTGSTGKTTTKEMLAEVLSAQLGDAVLKTEGNFNNLIGLPLTVFRLGSSHETAVLEMGMNMRGEIRRLSQIAAPKIGVITNVSAVHLEHLKTIGAVAEAKGELLEDFGADNLAVLNADDARVIAMAKGRDFATVTFGMSESADVRAENIRQKGFEGIDFNLRIGNESTPATLSCIGKHNVYNALAAAAAAHAYSIPVEKIVQGLGAFRPAAMRSRILDIFGIKVIDDTYNANPSSMDAALSMLVELTEGGRAIACLGDMFELGDEAEATHRRLGRHAGKLGIDRLYLLGEMANTIAQGALEEKLPDRCVEIVASHKELVLRLRDEGRRGDVILVKGSRGMRMERIVRGLKGEPV